MQKKNIASPNIGQSESENQTSVSAYAPQSILKNRLKSPVRSEQEESVVKTTVDNFANNPLFQPSNPNHVKNRQIYLDALSESGFNKEKLQKAAEQTDALKEQLNNASKAVNENPKNSAASYDAGTALLGLNKPDDAIAMFNTTLGNLKNDTGAQGIPLQNELAMNTSMEKPANIATKALFGIGSAYSQKGDYDASLAAYKDAMETLDRTDPNDAKTRAMISKGLAYVSYKLGDKESSKKFISKAKDLETEAEKQNAPFEAMKSQLQEETGAEQAQQKQADYMNDIANGLESFIKGDTEDKMGVLGKMTPWGFVYHNAKEMGQGILEGAKKYGEGQLNVMTGADPTKGYLQMGAGAAHAAFSSIPQIAVFNSALQPINEAAELNPDNKVLGTIAAIPEKIFAPAHAIADAINLSPEKGSNWDLALELADLASVIIGGKYLHEKIKNTNDAIDALKGLSDEAQKNPGEASKKVKEFEDGLNNVSANELLNEAQKEGKTELANKLSEGIEKAKQQKIDADKRDAELLEIQPKREAIIGKQEIFELPDDVYGTLDRLESESGIPVDAVALKESKDKLYNEYQRLSALKSDKNRMFTIAQINDAMETLQNSASEIDKYGSHEIEKSPELKALEKEKAQLGSAEVSDVMKPEIEVAKQNLEEKIKKQREVDNENLKAGAHDEAELNELNEQSKLAKNDIKTAEESGNQPVADLAKQKLEALDARKKEIEGRRALRKEQRLNKFLEGETAEKKAAESEMEFSSPEEADRFVAENSDNPSEVAERYLSTEKAPEMDAKGQLIEDNGIKVTEADFRHFTGLFKKDLTPAERKYIDNNADSIGRQVEKINSDSDVNLSEQDIIDHIQNMGRKASSPHAIELKTKLKKRFKELTGKDLTPELAKEIINHKKIKSERLEKESIEKENLKKSEEERAYYKGVKEGTVPTFDSERFGNVPKDMPKNKEALKEAQKIKAKNAGIRIEAETNIKSKFDEAMQIEKAISEETDMKKLRELKRKNKEFRDRNPGIAETMNKFKAVTDKLSKETDENGEPILKKSKGCK